MSLELVNRSVTSYGMHHSSRGYRYLIEDGSLESFHLTLEFNEPAVFLVTKIAVFAHMVGQLTVEVSLSTGLRRLWPLPSGQPLPRKPPALYTWHTKPLRP